MTYLKPIRPWPDIHSVLGSRANISRKCTLMHTIGYQNIFIRCIVNLFLLIISITINRSRMALFRWRYTGCSPGTSSFIKNFLVKQRIVPSLTRLVGDLIGMEAGRETNIGDNKQCH